MIAFFNILPELCILLFITITFLFSFYDKISDWNGNVSFIKQHFDGTFIKPIVPFSLFVITILELLAGIFSIVGIYNLFSGDIYFAILGCIISLLVLFIFLIGQRIAKDFDGAMKITVYIIPIVLCIYFLIN